MHYTPFEALQALAFQERESFEFWFPEIVASFCPSPTGRASHYLDGFRSPPSSSLFSTRRTGTNLDTRSLRHLRLQS
jgi:hypothetical protein